MKRSLLFRGFQVGGYASALALLASLATLITFLCIQGLPALSSELFFGDTPPIDALLGNRPVWDGIWPACVGTLCLVGLTLALALFPGIGCGIFLAEYATPKQKTLLGGALTLLAGMPSIVMGLFGFTLILYLRHTFLPDANTCLLLASGCLAFLVLPVLAVNTLQALEAVPATLCLTAAALGIGKGQRIRHILLPAAARGIGGGVLLALGRAAEDTAVIMMTGAVANAGLPSSLSAKFEALPFTIYYIAAQYQDQAELSRGFGAALVLLVFSGSMILVARSVESRYHARWHGGKV